MKFESRNRNLYFHPNGPTKSTSKYQAYIAFKRLSFGKTNKSRLSTLFSDHFCYKGCNVKNPASFNQFVFEGSIHNCKISYAYIFLYLDITLVISNQNK